MQEKDLAELRRQVQALEQQISALRVTVEALAADDAGAAAVPPQPARVPAPQPAYVPSPEPAWVPTPPAAPAPPPPATPKAPKAPRAPRSAADVEINLVGVWFNRIAIVLLLLASLYGFAWASDRGLIGPAAKVALGFAAALLSLGVGYRTHTKGLRIWSLGITGLGAGLLFASDWAAFQLFHLFPFSLAFALMVLSAIATVGLALRYDALPVAWLGTFGAYLTPFLLATRTTSPLGLLTYTAIVSLAILVLAAFRRWPSLNILGGAASWLIFIVAAVEFQRTHAMLLLGFASLDFLIWTGAAVLYGLIHRVQAHWRELTLALVTGAVYLLFGVNLLFEAGHADRQGFLAFGVALFYALAAFGVMRARRTVDLLLPHILLAAAGASLAAAIGMQFKGHWTDMALAVEGGALVWAGLRHRITVFRYEGVIVLLLAGVAYLSQRQPSHYSAPFAIALVAMGAAAWAFRRMEGADSEERNLLGAVTGVLTLLLSLLWIHDQTAAWSAERLAAARCPRFGYCPDRAGIQAAGAWLRSTLWGALGFLLLAGGLGLRERILRLTGVGVIGLALAAVGIHDIWLLNGGWRVLGLFALGSLLLIASYLYFRFKDRLLSR